VIFLYTYDCKEKGGRMLKMKSILIPLAVTALLLAASGCSRGGDQSPPLAGTEWKLVELNGRAPLQGTEISLNFEEERGGGNSGCNSYGGAYTSGAEGKLEFGEIEQTVMFCMEPEGVMDQETEYARLLLQAASYRMADGQLEILDGGGVRILKFERQ
jgi:heat shock protein HslJ